MNQGEQSPLKSKSMSFIVIETFGGPEYATIVTDEYGNNLVFENRQEADDEAADCQDGIVIEL
jgi:hypothetical protein